MITPQNKSIILKTSIILDAPAYLITDNASEIETLRDMKMKIIQLVRPDGKYRREAAGVACVQTLEQAWRLISKET